MSAIRTYLSDLAKHEGRIEMAYQIHRQSAHAADRTSFDAGYEAACSLFWNEPKVPSDIRDRLQAIIDWADLATANSSEFNGHGVALLSGEVFDKARAALAAQSPAPIGEMFKGAIDTDSRLQAAAREAGWALTELVDVSDWQRRDQISGIIGRLAAALIDADTTAPAPISRGDDDDRMTPIDDLIGELQGIRSKFGNTCVYLRRGGMSWGAVALNRRADDEKSGVFDLQAQHDKDMLALIDRIERLKAERNELRAALTTEGQP